MPSLANLRSVLAVKDLAASVEFYRESLGFRIEFEVPGWAFLSRDQFQVMLGECADAMAAHETGDHSYFAYVTVEGIDDLYQELAAKGVERVQELSDWPWGMREFGVRTPDASDHVRTAGRRLSTSLVDPTRRRRRWRTPT